MTTVTLRARDAAGNLSPATQVTIAWTGAATKTEWGFNIWSSYDGYSQPGPAESSAQLFARLKAQGFPPFKWAKVFYSAGTTYNLPATWAKSAQGELDPTCPAKHFLVMFRWTPGSLADGSHDVQLKAYMQSVQAAGVRVSLGMNEPDNGKVIGAQWPLYRADMDHLYDLKTSLGLTNVEVRDCFMDWSLDPASGGGTPDWSDSWINPAKRDGIIIDGYWNTAGTDKSGQTKIGRIVTLVKRLGLDWIMGETGDRKPGTPNSTETNDTTRAASMKTRYSALLACERPPVAVLWFDVIGSTGNHTMRDEDVATRAQWASFMSQ